MKTKAIIVPGNGGDHPEDKWFPYVSKELRKLGVDVINIEFPDPVLARKEYWLPFLEKLGTDEHTILIGHSSGAVAAIRYAENHKILGSVLVGSYHHHLGDEDEKRSGYFDDAWRWDKAKSHQQWIIQFHSTDDPYIPTEQARFIKEKLNTEYHEFTDRGHFGQDKLPELVIAIKEKLKTIDS